MALSIAAYISSAVDWPTRYFIIASPINWPAPSGSLGNTHGYDRCTLNTRDEFYPYLRVIPDVPDRCILV